MENIKFKETTPNLDRLARDSRSGTTPVSLKVKNKTYAIFKEIADKNNTSVGSMINELIDNYIVFGPNHQYEADDEAIAAQLIKDKMERLGKKLYNFNNIELSAYICEQSKKGLIDLPQPFETPTDVYEYVDEYILNNEDLHLNTISAPIIRFDERADFYTEIDWDAKTGFPAYYSLTIRKKCAKLVLPLLLAYVDNYNKYVLHENYDISTRPCITEKQFRNLVDIMNGNYDIDNDYDKKQLINMVVEVLVND